MLTHEQVAVFETRLITAMKESNILMLDALLAEDLIFTGHTGQVFTKFDDLDAHRSGNVEIFEINAGEQVIKIMGDTAVVSVLLEISGSVFGNTEVGFFRFTRVWKQAGDGMQVIAAHATQVVS
ncbi:nuclear transport factor 2 family protein [Flavobacterium sp. MFBS3-15]|uniref:nuclear transport factor 2 family protein n=1 Tax=Flavobacterium sp. MFBS3-15 TaxID=2989816 RepID=UPI00223579A5|nr:nuclear transport factor 2 family protein [Flavobacterium sp. MFBS3-15]MCW4467483.1 nuclear transport factor 2 family protein [Flavobacterium sp. MFBS3-15]